ncbi:glycosyltransferase family 4 protein [Pedobacter sp. UBA4863]|uniref:glycosyltransferase family 4 protein n=1 Tax=Pedobacter sp. UBA4863 TaxID=1947060 RepID=UPI0025DCEA66|nr:glycosyltransferase family 4 protein [Pedobacter sp. UBA4863]
MDKLKKILFLPGWYPNRTHLSVGSFVRSHAEAVNELVSVDVFHVCGDEELKMIYSFEKTKVNDVNTYILYYRKSKSKHVISQFVKAFLYVFGQFYGYYKYRRIAPKPDFFHVHVLTRAAILPYVLKLFSSNIKYFITEHWSRYLPQDNSYQGFLRKRFTKSVVSKSRGITAVSENLKFHMSRHGLEHQNFTVISNVTESRFFESSKAVRTVENHFVHVSNFAANCKNVIGIIDAFEIIKNKGYVFSLTMVGDGTDHEAAFKYVKEKDLKEVNFTGFLYGKDVVGEIEKATALVLFSNYENQPVVITESLSLGVPVIATKVGGIPEMINETNGILVESNDVDALANALKQIIKKEKVFDSEKIRTAAAQKFKGEVIARQFVDFYRAGGVEI